MEAKKSKKAAIENQRGSWLLMGLVVALAFMFVSFEWTQHDVRVAAVSSDDESIFVTELVPIRKKNWNRLLHRKSSNPNGSK